MTATGNEVYKPTDTAPYINFSLDASSFTPTPSSWTNTSGTNVSLQWVAGFSSVTGSRILNTNANTGVNTVQTTADTGAININAGTLRVSQ